MNDNKEERNDTVIYKSEDGLVKMEAMVAPVNETIWANQKAIAALFDVTVPNISYHFKKIFESGDLDAGTVVKDFLITAHSGARGTFEDKILYYNLDAIISVSYRINSLRASKFKNRQTTDPRELARDVNNKANKLMD